MRTSCSVKAMWIVAFVFDETTVFLATFKVTSKFEGKRNDKDDEMGIEGVKIQLTEIVSNS